MSTKKGHPLTPAVLEPMLPESAVADLSDLTCDILRKAGELSAQLPAAIVRTRMAGLVREMNSYYSNLIEGHKTLPRDIERALRGDYSANPEKRGNQHLNRAHIEVEQLMLDRLEREPELSIHSPEFLCWLHREFYARLPDDLHFSEGRTRARHRIQPGMLRTFEVVVGRHHPPNHAAIPALLQRFGEFYGGSRIAAANQLVALAAAHHRLAWIHPLGDGNGRVTRLYSHAWLVRRRADGLGLWTLSRGLARQRQEYYARLQAADQPRWNDLDGRGNLSDRGLGEFCRFLLRTMLDQIDFMTGLLQPQNLAARIERHVHFEYLKLDARTRGRLARLLQAALLEGEIERGRVGEIIGLRGTAARAVIRLALGEKLLGSTTEKGPLSLVFNSQTIESYFPKLFQDLPVEAA